MIKTEQELEGGLWAIKEAAWELYASAFWEPGIGAMVHSITKEVNETLRSLGYDPAIRPKEGK